MQKMLIQCLNEEESYHCSGITPRVQIMDIKESLLLQSQVIEPECQSFTSFLIYVYISAVYLSVGCFYISLFIKKKKNRQQAGLLFTAYVQVWSIMKGKSDSLISII